MHSNSFFKITNGRVAIIPSILLNTQKEESIITYPNFPNIVSGGSINIPDLLEKVQDVYEFIVELGSDFTINKDDIDFYFRKLKGEDKNRFIELFGVVETLHSNDTTTLKAL